ncbi:hypothetical protein OIU78_012784 [Salix suchowensis]|nr:hypothetical protein OIU78_012784 [Salix suchowensis]
MDMLHLKVSSSGILTLLLIVLRSLPLISLVGVDQVDLTLPAKALKKLRRGSLTPLRNGEKQRTLVALYYSGIHFGGYVAAKYALKHPEHVQHLILVGPAGFSSESESKSEWLAKFRETWKGAVLNHLWESNFTPQKVVRGLGPWGPDLVNRYTTARFGAYSTGEVLTEEESKLLSDYVYHTLAAKASGELCLKYIFSFGAFARMPLIQRSDNPTYFYPFLFL